MLPCSKCATPYHIVYKPSPAGDKCPCGGELIQRDDDNEQTVKNRIEVYHNQTEPIKEYYEKQGILVVASGCDAVEDTTKAVFKALGI